MEQNEAHFVDKTTKPFIYLFIYFYLLLQYCSPSVSFSDPTCRLAYGKYCHGKNKMDQNEYTSTSQKKPIFIHLFIPQPALWKLTVLALIQSGTRSYGSATEQITNQEQRRVRKKQMQKLLFTIHFHDNRSKRRYWSLSEKRATRTLHH